MIKKESFSRKKSVSDNILEYPIQGQKAMDKIKKRPAGFPISRELHVRRQLTAGLFRSAVYC
jgi:hypothetical protein